MSVDKVLDYEQNCLFVFLSRAFSLSILLRLIHYNIFQWAFFEEYFYGQVDDLGKSNVCESAVVYVFNKNLLKR